MEELHLLKLPCLINAESGGFMNIAFPNSVASALALIFVEKNSKEGMHPEELFKMYADAFEIIKDLEKQQRQENYRNS